MRVAVALAFAACAHYPKVRERDVAMESVFVAEIVTNGMQSGAIVDSCVESNPIIGRCGDRVALWPYLGVVLVTHAAISTALPPGRWRTAFMIAADVIEAGSVIRNAQLGWMP